MTQYWGPRYWYFLHSLINSYPDEPTDLDKILYKQMLMLFIKLLPCSKCYNHFIEIIKQRPAQMTNKTEWILWGFNIHNKVNIRLKKKKLKWDKFESLYQNINHQYLYDFLIYNKNRAYQNQIQFNDFIMLLNMSMLVFPCNKCRKSYNYKYRENNVSSFINSRTLLDKWINRHIQPNGFHYKKKKKKKKHKQIPIETKVEEITKTDNTVESVDNKIQTEVVS